ncbi:hypothetical protein [Achromobacter aloeverae]
MSNTALAKPAPLKLDQAVVKRKALRQLVRNGLVESGLPAEAATVFMENLRDLGLDALLPAIQVCVFVDIDVLMGQRSVLHNQQAMNTMLRRFIQAGAGTALLRTLFPAVSLQTIDSIRQDLNVAPPIVAEELSPDDHSYMRRTWGQLCAQMHDPRERYLALHESLPRYSLYTLFCALNQGYSQPRART